MKILAPIFFIGVALGLLLVYINPTYAEIKTLKQETSRLDQALTKSKELQEVRNALNSRRNAFRKEDLDRLGKLLPDHIDNVRLIIDVDNIAAKYGLTIRDFSFSAAADTRSSDEDAGLSTPYGSVEMGFQIQATYNNFLVFLRDLERSLRLMDVVAISVSPSEEGNLYSYSITFRTYWLH